MSRPQSPYEGARVEELEEPLLPRWFVVLAVVSVPVALGVAVWAFVVFGPDEVAVAERRPPPPESSPLTTDVGRYNVGTTPARPVPLEDCELFQGIGAAGSDADRQRIATALSALCEAPMSTEVAERMRSLAQSQGVIRFAQFEATGVDSTLDLGATPPVVLVNARFARADTEPLWIAPLVVHDVTYLDAEPGLASSELAARRAEARTCEVVLTDVRPSRACQDAEKLLRAPDSLQALEAAGFR